MAFQRPQFRLLPTHRPRGPVFPVGGRAYVANLHGNSSEVTLTDEHGRAVVATLADGSEVAVLGWWPGMAGTTRYRVRVAATGAEGWLPTGNLRTAAVPKSITGEVR
jgi:hypothetical protein